MRKAAKAAHFHVGAQQRPMLDSEEVKMKFRKCSFLVVGLVMSVLSGVVAAESVAIAYSPSSENTAWVRRANQNEANKVAIKLCNQDAQKRDCVLSSIKALAKATGSDRVAYGWSNKSISDAKRDAVANCKQPDCKIVDLLTEPGFISLARSDEDKEGNVHFHTSYAYDNPEEAYKTALGKCKERSGQECKIVITTSIAGTLREESPANAKPVAPVATNQNCRPKTPTIRCTSSCANGDCLVTYENGCKMRVQVSPRYDSFQNTWVYPSPSC